MADSDATQTNARMREYWDREAGPRWVVQQAQLDAQLQPFCDAVLARAAIREGERVIDIGCGCGATTVPAARQVGSSGRVVAIDLSGPMLKRTAERVAAAGHGDRLEVVRDDAQTHEFGDAGYDVVLSRFGVMFFDDPDVAFRNFAVATRSGGRLVFACWQGRDKNPWMSVPAQSALRYLEAPPPPEPDAPGPFSLVDPDRVSNLLERAGYRDIRLEAFEDPIRMADLDTAANLMIDVGPVAGLVRDQQPGPEVLEKVRGAVRDALATFDTPEGVVAPAAAWIVSAERA